MTDRYVIEEVVSYRLVKLNDRGWRTVSGIFRNREQAEQMAQDLTEYAAQQARDKEPS